MQDADAAASRAYYAAFYAVSALFADEGRSFLKHAALEAVLHKDLVKPGLWDQALGKAFSWLRAMRSLADYGTGAHVSEKDALDDVAKAQAILARVQEVLSNK